jgi:anthranilate synthase component 2
MKILVIDNYDSFTYNLVHLIKIASNAEVEVFYNDQITIEAIKEKSLDAIVISPGPSDPDASGITLEVIAKFYDKLPIFGVCLGHQAIGQFFGSKIIRIDPPMHGKVDIISHFGNKFFDNIPHSFNATRYHSLVIDQNSLPDCLTVIATSKDSQIMAIAHKSLPIFGVQFHPESIASEYGKIMIKNFLNYLD